MSPQQPKQTQNDEAKILGYLAAAEQAEARGDSATAAAMFRCASFIEGR